MAEFQFTPVADLQIAIWIEDAAGEYIDTVFVTNTTGIRGLGNRPGRADFDSEILWPYGRREMVLPVWAHRRNIPYPRVGFQDGDENDLSHAVLHSSVDSYYCRPLAVGESAWEATVDSGSCATTAFTDKGKLSTSETSLYPPRNDLGDQQPGDHVDMHDYSVLNDLDAVSRATPAGGAPFSHAWTLPPELPSGEYVAWIEVSREGDFNSHYDPESYPSPSGLPWAEYGRPWRGQPSVVWKLPFSVRQGEVTRAAVAEYAGYGDPDGLDGILNPPDATIDTVAGTYQVLSGKGAPRTVETFGAARLLLESGEDGAARFRVIVRDDDDEAAPGQARDLTVTRVETTSADLRVVVPGDDDFVGQAAAYEVRFGVGAPPVDEAGFLRGEMASAPSLRPAGEAVEVELTGLLPQTKYWVAFRALDDCGKPGPLASTSFQTAAAESGEVDYCFVATAAYGSLFAGQVGVLRSFRDRVLRRSLFGELFVQAYYTFGPAAAVVVRPSDVLRELARAGLEPLAGLAGEATAHED